MGENSDIAQRITEKFYWTPSKYRTDELAASPEILVAQSSYKTTCKILDIPSNRQEGTDPRIPEADQLKLINLN